MRNWKARAVQSSNAICFGLCVPDLIGVDALLGLKDCIDAFRWNDELTLKAENERGVMPVEDNNVDLIAECPKAVNNVRSANLVTLWQVFRKQFEPDTLAGISLGNRMGEYTPSGSKPVFDIIVKPRQELC